MPISDGMKYLEQKKFTFLGIMLSVMFGISGVYTSFFYEKKPEISFDILSNTPVYDLREEIPSLQVIFSGEDIKSKGQSLSILTVRLSNTGNASLLLSHFDPREPFGLSLNNVKILKVDTLGASNGYLMKNLPLLTTIKEDKILIAPLILDQKDYALLKLLLIHPVGLIPKVEAFGKIAQINKINVIEVYKTNQAVSFWSETFHGNFLVQMIRLLIYGIALITLTIAILGTIVAFPGWQKNWKRKRIVRNYRSKYKEKIEKECSSMLDGYIEYGEEFISNANKVLNRKASLKTFFQHESANFAYKKKEAEKGNVKPSEYMLRYGTVSSELFDVLNNNKIIRQEGSELIVDQKVAKFVKSFYLYLKTNYPKMIKAHEDDDESL